MHSFKFTLRFSEQELWQRSIIVTRYGVSLDSDKYLLKDSLLEFEEYCVYLRKTIVAFLLLVLED